MPVLAQYGIRSKQDYIFRTNRMVEMSGASALISGAFDRLSAQAEKLKLGFRRCDEPFSLEDVLRGFADGSLQMVELTRGGGNCTVLFDTEDTFRNVNAAYTHDIAVKVPGMVPLCVGVPVGADGVWNYGEDRARLVRAVSAEKAAMTRADCIAVMPFSELTPMTLQPVTAVAREHGELRYLSSEAEAKRKEGDPGDLEGRLIEEKGQESLLAVVHADGNNMGRKIHKLLEGQEDDYTVCVNKMRAFTEQTARIFSGRGAEAVKKACGQLSENAPKSVDVLWLICDGDDATFVCNARYAKTLAEAYLRAVENEAGYSSCAGICIFHSRYPFHMAYSMAEQCCDNAKRKIHLPGAGIRDESWIDFHYIHSGLNGDLDDIREEQGTARRMARPFCLKPDAEPSLSALDALAKLLKDAGVTRGNIKTVGAEWEKNRENGRSELHRVWYRARGLKERAEALCPDEDRLLSLFYDLSEVYDLWYAQRGDKQ